MAQKSSGNNNMVGYNLSKAPAGMAALKIIEDMGEKTSKLILITLVMLTGIAKAIDNTQARAFEGRDVQITCEKLTYYDANGINLSIAEGSVSISAGADAFTGENAVIWLNRNSLIRKVDVWCYLSGKIWATKHKGTGIPGLNWEFIDENRDLKTSKNNALMVHFETKGEIFFNSKANERANILDREIYNEAYNSAAKVYKNFKAEFGSVAPAQMISHKEVQQQQQPAAAKKTEPQRSEEGFGGLGFIDRLFGPAKKAKPMPENIPQNIKIRYPINLAPAGEQEPNIDWGGSAGLAAGEPAKAEQFATIIGRFYLWQKQNEQGLLFEMQADNAVVFYSSQKNSSEEYGGVKDIGSKGLIKAIYVSGDVVLTEGLRTIRADEVYYDFENKKGLAVNAAMRTFDIERGIPIYIRAAKIRQIAEGKFATENVIVTTSEFAKPQLSMEVSSIIVTDRTTVDQEAGQFNDSSYDAQMKDIRLKAGDMTIFCWPSLRSNLERPDVPFKSLRIGNDSIWGTTVETRWFLSRLLGLREPEGTDGTFNLDYFSKRGFGTGIDLDYKREDRFGTITGYLAHDHGEDRLGRVDFRKDLEPPRDLRGIFAWEHREFMPYNWQLSTGIDYESDENFLESYRRHEYNTGFNRETYLHLKRIEDNWGIAILGKGRINDFADELEEIPTGEYHLTGQSICDDKMTLYSDTYGGRYRQRIGNDHDTIINEDNFAFVNHRTELDVPLTIYSVKTVSFAAGTFGYDDRSGFNRRLVDGGNEGRFNEEAVGIGEVGTRASTDFWKIYPKAKSRLFDLNGLRHIITPSAAASIYAESDPTVEQHNALRTEITQRLQTKRGTDDRIVDWMRLNVGATWFEENEKRSPDSGPYRFLWNNPMTPLRTIAMPGILNGDLGQGLKKFEQYGPVRDYLDAEYMWQINDMTALLSDVYYDIHEGTIEQLDIGFSRMRWPDLSFYIGSRYLRNTQILDEHGTNAFVFTASYNIDERYTLVFSQQYDFDYGANVESELTLIRRYHRIFWSFTLSTDASLDRQSVVFNLWPEGAPELAGSRYSGLTGPGGY